MKYLDSLKTLVEWAISSLCLIGAAALFLQQEWLGAFATFAFGLGMNPPLQANNIIKACLILLAFLVLFSR